MVFHLAIILQPVRTVSGPVRGVVTGWFHAWEEVHLLFFARIR